MSAAHSEILKLNIFRGHSIKAIVDFSLIHPGRSDAQSRKNP